MQQFIKKFGFIFITFYIVSLFFGCTQARTNITDTSFVGRLVASENQSEPVFLGKGLYWVDSVYNALTDDQRLGQLFMAPAYSRTTDSLNPKLIEWIQKYNLGGLIFMQGSPKKQAIFTNYYQSLAPTPLLISMDAEYGLKMRLDSTLKFPNQLTMGALANNDLIYKMGAEMAKQCKRIGVHVSFSPVVDINNNPNNPVINFRSFGESKEDVALKAFAYMKGLQDNGVLACLKHFPGHGDTDSDSHYTLPKITASQQRLDSLELFPYQFLIKKGASSVMVAHLNIPAIDTAANRPTSLSYKSTTNLLQNELGFKGLIFTDALNMKGVADYFEPGDLELQAILAGNDVLLFSEHLPIAIERIKLAISRQELNWIDLEKRIKKILLTKYWCGLASYMPIDLNGLNTDLNTNNAKNLIQNIYEDAITLVKDEFFDLPIQSTNGQKITALSIGKTSSNDFGNCLELYAPVKHFQVNNKKEFYFKNVVDAINSADFVIIGYHLNSQHARQNFGVDDELLAELKKLALKKPIHLIVFGNPYSLPKFSFAHSLMVAYEDNPATHLAATQAFFGAIPFNGTLPVSASAAFPLKLGMKKPFFHRLKYGFPESEGISSELISKIDQEVNRGISAMAFPGCQVWVAVGNTVIVNKSYGHFRYDQKQKVQLSTIYDLASITKVAATAMGLMDAFDNNLFPLDSSLSFFLPKYNLTTKRHLTPRLFFTHQAGLQPFIPIWKTTVTDSLTRIAWFNNRMSASHTIQVSDTLFVANNILDSIDSIISNSGLQPIGQYKYSDLAYYFGLQMVEKFANKNFYQYLNERFYVPLDLATMGFLPLNRFPKNRIAPTEVDKLFRQTEIQGFVHDQTAALMGGVAGHAGLFSNANDLGKLFFMLNNKGVFAGKSFLSQTVIDTFVTAADGVRRGICFDKPEKNPILISPTAKAAPLSTFGHTGFTGTSVWADPDNQIIVVFLSNRIHPNAETNKLASLNIRTNIQQLVYDYFNSRQTKPE